MLVDYLMFLLDGTRKFPISSLAVNSKRLPPIWISHRLASRPSRILTGTAPRANPQ